MKEIKLNLGCGDVKLHGFIGLDGKFGDDITDLDYEDNSVDEIYSSHTLEYFDQIEVVDVLREWYRVLKKGGIIRLAVPDFEKLTTLYLATQMGLEEFPKTEIRDIIGPLMGRMEMDGDLIFHKNLFDEETLSQLMYQVGFKRIKRYDCESVKPFSKVDDQSHCYKVHMDKSSNLLSLNLEATK